MSSKLSIVAANVLLAGVYFLSGRMGLSFAIVHENATAVWPPTGIAIAAVLLWGRKLLPGVAVGAFMVNFATPAPLPAVLGIVAGNTLEAFAGAWLAARFASGRSAFTRPDTIFRFVGLSALVAPAISATFGLASIALSGIAASTDYTAVWVTWWLGDVVSALILTPLIVTWVVAKPRSVGTEWARVIALLVLLAATSAVVFGGFVIGSAQNYPLDFALIAPLLWSAYRFRQHGATVATTVLSAAAIAGTLNGYGPFALLDPNGALVVLQAFMGTMSVASLVLAAVVSQQVNTEEKLQVYHQIFANSIDGIAITNARGEYTEQNAEHRKLLGYDDAELCGKTSALHMNPEEHAALTQALAETGSFRGEVTSRSKDGRTLVIELAAFALRNKRGEGVGYVGIKRDATRRRHETEALRESERRLRLIAENTTDVIFAFDMERNPIYINPAVLGLTGYTFEEIRAKKFVNWIHPADAARMLALWENLFSGHSYSNEEFRMVARDGCVKWCLSTWGPIYDENGRQIGVQGREQDITERKRAQEALEVAQAELRQYADELEQRVAQRTAKLEETVKSLESFCYSIAHDLRAPLRAMQGLATVLREDYDAALDATGREYTSRIVAAANRMDALIQDLLAYGRLSHEELILSEVSLDAQIRFVQAGLAGEVNASDAIVEVQSPLPVVWANPAVLSQVLTNLMSNALKFVPPGVRPHIRIWSESNANSVTLAIQDNGIGIEPIHLDRIFNVFERLHASDAYPGTGIGLAIVRKGIERLGGRVRVESEFGKGSCFRVEVPAAPRDAGGKS